MPDARMSRHDVLMIVCRTATVASATYPAIIDAPMPRRAPGSTSGSGDTVEANCDTDPSGYAWQNATAKLVVAQSGAGYVQTIDYAGLLDWCVEQDCYMQIRIRAGDFVVAGVLLSLTCYAGAMILLSVVLTAFVSPLWMWFTVFIGLNLIQSAFTGFCPAAIVFRKMGVKAGCAFE